MPCNNLAVQRAQLVPKILQELRASEAAREVLRKLVEKAAPGIAFRVSMPEYARTHTGQRVTATWVGVFNMNGPELRVWVNEDKLTVSGSNPATVARLQAYLEAQLPSLAKTFAGLRIRAGVEKRFPGTKTERLSAGTYRQTITI
jgi:hypothetical protein